MAGSFVHHVPILTEGEADGAPMGRRVVDLLPAEPGNLKGLLTDAH